LIFHIQKYPNANFYLFSKIYMPNFILKKTTDS